MVYKLSHALVVSCVGNAVEAKHDAAAVRRHFGRRGVGRASKGRRKGRDTPEGRRDTSEGRQGGDAARRRGGSEGIF